MRRMALGTRAETSCLEWPVGEQRFCLYDGKNNFAHDLALLTIPPGDGFIVKLS